MTSAELENLVRLGQLKREPPLASEIRGLLPFFHQRSESVMKTGVMKWIDDELEADLRLARAVEDLICRCTWT